MYTLFAFLAFVSTFIGLLPQILKCLSTKSAKDLSYIWLFNYLIGSFCWCVYGFADFYILLSNIFGVLSSLLLILLKLFYEKTNEKK